MRLPADTCAANVTYTFGLTVKGADGTATAKPVTVVVHEAQGASGGGLPRAGDSSALGLASVELGKRDRLSMD